MLLLWEFLINHNGYRWEHLFDPSSLVREPLFDRSLVRETLFDLVREPLFDRFVCAREPLFDRVVFLWEPLFVHIVFLAAKRGDIVTRA
uniref:Uncharacterized protein n=1 Tax=Peronospora matthiolae TaxID=2874970 RepID=A0AAV1UM96_9STRA